MIEPRRTPPLDGTSERAVFVLDQSGTVRYAWITATFGQCRVQRVLVHQHTTAVGFQPGGDVSRELCYRQLIADS
jgi:hypothetical protein